MELKDNLLIPIVDLTPKPVSKPVAPAKVVTPKKTPTDPDKGDIKAPDSGKISKGPGGMP